MFVKNTWEVLDTYRNWTSLPIVLKGIQNVQDARAAVDHGVPAIILSNHGGRNLDGSPSSLEVALEIYNNDPDIFSQTEVLADGGVRYGTDALRLMALGVKAVGMGRPFMFSNVFGVDGVEKVITLMKNGLMNDAANLGLVRTHGLSTSSSHPTLPPQAGREFIRRARVCGKFRCCRSLTGTLLIILSDTLANTNFLNVGRHQGDQRQLCGLEPELLGHVR